MKKRFHKLTAMLLSLALTLSSAAAIPIAAAETGAGTPTVTRDAFGIMIEGDLTAEQVAQFKADNPYGTQEWFPLFTANELYYVEGHEDGRYFRSRDYDGVTMGTVRGTGELIGSKDEGNDDGFSMMDTSPIDLNGTGSKEYVATVAYWQGGDKLELFVTDKNGDRVTNTYNLADGDSINNLDDVAAYATTGFVSVAAGDFDGDGVDTIIAYIPRMESASPAIAEYKIEGKNIVWVRDVLNENVFSLLGQDDLTKTRSKASRVLRNTPVVQILAEDVDNDNIDEVIITAGMNDTYDNVGKGVDGNGKVGSQLFIYDFVPEYPDGDSTVSQFVQTFGAALHESGSGQSADSSGRLRFASSSVGNVTATTGGVDYPEIIAAGWIDSDGGNDIGLDGKKINFNQITCTKSVVSYGTTIGNYSHSSLGSVDTKEFVYGGFYDDSVEALVPVQVFSPWGAGYADAIFAGGVVYKIENNQITELYHRDYFDDDDDGIGSHIITNGLIIDVTAGNFTNDPDGREQLVFATMQKQHSVNDYFSCMYTYTCDEGSYQDPGQGWNSYDDGWLTYDNADAFITLCAPDLDPTDSTVVRIKNVTRTYTEPEVLAILEATPYFAEIPDSLNNSETSYGKSDTAGVGSSSSNTLQTNIVAGFEWSMDDIFAGFACGAGFEASIENNFTWTTSNEQYETFEVNYANDSGENAVIVYRRPVIAYEYEVRGSDKNLVLAKEGELSTSMISVDEYNEAAAQYGLDVIPEGLLGEPGNPFSYRSSSAGLKNAATKDNLTTQYNGTGTVTQSFTNGTSTSSEYEYELNTSFTAYGLVFGAKVGGGAGYAHTTSESTVNTTEIAKSGTVSGVTEEGYDFQWQFAHWNTTINGTEVPVLGYIVKDVVAPPSPPTGLSVDEITTTSATVTWNHGSRPAEEYRIYQYFAANDKYIQIAAVDGTETSCTISNFLPGETYTVVIRAYTEPTGNGGIGGESVNSEALAFATAPEGAAPIMIDGAYDVHTMAGSDAEFTVDVILPGEKYTTVSYQWQKREPNSSWVDIKDEEKFTLTLENVTQDMDGTLYRCEIGALYLGSLITYYGDVGKLNVGKASTEATLTVEGHTGGYGTVAEPYLGKADYLKQSGTNKTETVTKANLKIDHNDTELIVYGTANGESIGAPYYGYDAENGDYYALTESESAFTVDGKIETAIVKSYSGINAAPAGFDSEAQMSYDEGDTTYYLFAEVAGTTRTPIEVPAPEEGEDAVEAVDTRLESLTDITYYWIADGVVYTYGENGTVGDKVTDMSVDELYSVYVKTETNIVLGRGETYTVEEIGESEDDTEYNDVSELCYYSVIYTPATEGGEGVDSTPASYAVTAFTESESVKYTLNSEEYDFDSSNLTVVTTEVTNTVETPIYTLEEGTTITLNAVVTDNTGATLSSSDVAFRMINTVTGAVDELKAVTNSTGEASVTWHAPNADLYRIEVVVSGSGKYLGSVSETKYYDALGTETGVNTTEYRVLLTSDGKALVGMMPFGETFSYELQSREVGSSGWNDYAPQPDETFTYTVTAPGKSETKVDGAGYTPDAAGVYIVRVYKGSSLDATNVIASASLEVTRLSITIAPTWNVTPVSTDDITLTSTFGRHTDEYLKTIFNISCPYFTNNSSSGVFTVTLSYKNSTEADEFKNNFHATLKSGAFTIKPSSAPVYFESGENGSLVGRSGENLFLMESGSSRTSGILLTFNAEPNTGYAVDKWIINDVEYDRAGAEHPDWFEFDGDSLVIDSFDASEGSEQIKDGALEVRVAFKSASNAITYSVNGAGGNISAVNDSDTDIASGTSVANGANIVITAKPDANYVVDSWIVNNETYTWEDGTVYRGETLTLEDITSNYTVVVSFTAGAEYDITTSVYSEAGNPAAELATISAVDAESGEQLASLEGISKHTSVTFTASLNATNNTVKEWQTSTDGVTFTTVSGSGGKDSFTLYNLDADTDVRVIVTSAQSYTLNYSVVLNGETVDDSDIAKLLAYGNGVGLDNGGSYGAYIPVEFELSLNSDYYVDEWSENVTPDEDGQSANLASLNENTSVVVTIAEKPEVSVAADDNGTTTVDGINKDADDIDVVVGEDEAKHVDLGSDIVITAAPDENYYVSEVKVNGTAVYTDNADEYTGEEMTFDVENVTKDTEITVTYAEKPIVTFAGDENITVTAELDGDELTSGDHIEKYSENIVFTATPDMGYETDKWILDQTEAAPENDDLTENDITVYTVEDPVTANVVIGVTAKAIPQYTLTLATEKIDDNGSHGSISAAVTRKSLDDYDEEITQSGEFYRDSDITINVTPEDGYRIQYLEWNINGNTGKAMSIPEELLHNIQGDITVTARFVQRGDGIVIEPIDEESTGGYVSEAAAAGVDVLTGGHLEEGVDLELTATVKPGYEVEGWYNDDVLVDGTEGETKYTYKVKGDDETVIIVKFRQTLYTIETEITNGKIETATLTGGKARGGESLTFTATPDIGWAVSDWTVNGVSQNVSGNTFNWTVENGLAADDPTDTFTVKAVLVRSSFVVTYTDTVGGKLTSETASGTYVTKDETVTITAAADTGYTFKGWKVNGKTAAETSEILTLTMSEDYEVEAVFEADTYTVTFVTTGSKGTITATADGETVKSGDKVPHNAELTVTVKPSGTNMVNKWTIDGITPSGYEMSDTADAALTYTTTVTGEINITVEIIECPKYTVTVTAGDNGKVSDTSVIVSRNGSVTLTATPDAYYQFDCWTVDGEADETGGTTLTLNDIKKDMTVEASFKPAVRYDLTFAVVCETGNTSTATVTSGGTEIYPTADASVRLVGNSTVVFTASPAMNGDNNADMVASWTVNNIKQDTVANVFTIDKLTEKTHVVLTFEKYEGFSLPESGEGYTVSEIVRTPADTSPAGEIRKGGDISFKVSPAKDCTMTKLIVNGVDCLSEESNGISAVKNSDGSYTVTIEDISEAIELVAESLQFRVVVDDLTEVPAELDDKYATLKALKADLEDAVTDESKNFKDVAYFDITLQYTTDGGTTWKNADKDHFPAEGFEVAIDYDDIDSDADRTYTYTVIHMFTSNMDGNRVGDTEVVDHTEKTSGIEFTVTSLSPFAVGYYKKSTTGSGTGSGSGSGSGGGSSSVTYLIKASASEGGEIDPEGRVRVDRGDSITFTISADEGYVIKDVIVDGDSVGALDEYTFRRVTAAHTIEAVFEKAKVDVPVVDKPDTVISDCTEATCPMKPFTDLKYDEWYHDAVHYAIENDLMNGISQNTFDPSGTVTRSMIVTILWRLEGKPFVNYMMTFTDVESGTWYTEAVRWAASTGIVEGYNAETFGPDDAITREQLATMLYRYEQHKGGGFTGMWMYQLKFPDLDSLSMWAVEAVSWCNMKGVINGNGAGMLNPKGEASRAEAAQMLLNYAKVD
ncbi:MAG: S-layer homology domain-containing protein [Clostridia bacterium]|nr:S-layer homology domain-containing protein [Clostridia bacterium]